MTDLTADGVAIKRGDMAWRTFDYGYPRKVRMGKHHLYWMCRDNSEYFASERAALASMLERARAALRRARVDARRETKRVDELKRRLSNLAEET